MLSNHLIRREIVKLYKFNYFEQVEAHLRKRKGRTILEFILKERPIVTDIVFEGNSEVDEEDITAEMKTKKYSILDVNSIKADLKKIRKFYQEKGFYLASIDYELKKVSSEKVILRFKINEFEKVRIKRIFFLGNTAFSDSQLKDIMQTKEEGLFSSLSDSGSFKEASFQRDVEVLKYFYKTKGHLQVNIGKPEVTVTEDKRWVFITMKITEGPVFRVNEITFDGDLLFTEEELGTKTSLRPNEIYSEELMRRDIRMLTELYQDKGHAFANVLRTLSLIPGENKVDIKFRFEKGKLAKFGRITIQGNDQTRDKVVRRELEILEGALYSGSKLRRSRENVMRLGFFEQPSVVFSTSTPPGSDDIIDVQISVKETNTGQISLGAGYSTADKLFFQGSVTQRNFQGKGQVLGVTANYAKARETTVAVNFTEPHVFDTDWLAGGEIEYSKSDQDDAFTQKSKSFSIIGGHPIGIYTDLALTYRFEDVSVNLDDRDTDDGSPGRTEQAFVNGRRTRLIDEDLEQGLASSLTLSIRYDKRNNRQQPTNGHFIRFSTEYAGLGGDRMWGRSSLDMRFYKQIWGDLVFRSRLRTEKMWRVGGKDIPYGEKLRLGGPRNMRGFGPGRIGPSIKVLDKNINDEGPGTERYFNLRGLFSTFATVELQHPLAREAGLFWVLFADAGNVFNKYIGENDDMTLRGDYGFGFRWYSPIGVLRFEFGYPLNTRDNDDDKQFYFDLGQIF